MRPSRLLAFLLLPAALSCGPARGTRTTAPSGRVSTFQRVREAALAGDAEAQNLLGFMLFLGESAPASRPLARLWFEPAAAQGHFSAQLNLAVMHYLGEGIPEDRALAQQYFITAALNPAKPRDLSALNAFGTLPELVEWACEAPLVEPKGEEGEFTFLTYCSGCHGPNGIAALGESPSFALGERMEKSDDELYRSILGGHGTMPRWSDKLPVNWLRQALGFVRTLEKRHRAGILHVPTHRPPVYFRFGPMSTDFGLPEAPGAAYETNSDLPRDFCRGG